MVGLGAGVGGQQVEEEFPSHFSPGRKDWQRGWKSIAWGLEKSRTAPEKGTTETGFIRATSSLRSLNHLKHSQSNHLVSNNSHSQEQGGETLCRKKSKTIGYRVPCATQWVLNSAQYSKNLNRKKNLKRRDTCTCITELLCYTPETDKNFNRLCPNIK